MRIEIDLGAVPPAVVLHEPDDFRAFKVVVRDVDHTRVPIEVLEQLAGDRAAEPDWQGGFKRMLEYAEQHGWVDDRGVQAHIERE